MHSFIRILTVAALLAVSPLLTPTASAETLRFAWPDGASAKVRTRSEGSRVEMDAKDSTWDMTADFTMRVRHAGEHVRIERADFSGWKGTYPPLFGGGVDRFTDMIPTIIVSTDGKFVGIEGQKAARALINRSIEQSSEFDAAARSEFETVMSDAMLPMIGNHFWARLVDLWQGVELDSRRTASRRNTTMVPPLGELKIKAEVRFVKEAPCSSVQSGRRCLYFRSESAPDREHLVDLLESLKNRAASGGPVITDFEQQFKVEIIVDKATTLPQQLIIAGFNAIKVTVQGRTERAGESMTKTYDFDWTGPGGEEKK